MKIYIQTLFILISFSIQSQIEFEKGYFISNDNTKVDCYIKNQAWEINPEIFDYKLNLSDPSKEGSISEVKEFNVSDAYKYIRFTTNVDVSIVDIARIDIFKNPTVKEKTIFLKVISQGKATLYEYFTDNKRSFYCSSVPHETAELLVYKEYNFDQSTLTENNQYKQQLSQVMKDSNLKNSDFSNLQYQRKSISKLFWRYNAALDQYNKDYAVKQNKEIFKIKLLVGGAMVFTNFFINKNVNDNIKPIFSPIVGLEAEYVLPFNQNKWSVFISPNYQTYTINDVTEYKNVYPSDGIILGNYQKPILIKLSKIDIPIGARFYLFLNKTTKLFVNGGFILSTNLKGELEYSGSNFNGFGTEIPKINNYSDKTAINSSSSSFFGIGFSNKKLNYELRYNSSRPPIENSNALVTFKSIGLIASYSFN